MENVMIKNFAIFGDSYSTHKDYIPEGYHHYYCTEGRSPNEPVTKMRVEETWWGRLIDKTDAKLILNDSWSGSTIGYTGFGGDCSRFSFITRYHNHCKKGFFKENEINTIFVFGGTNDSWSNAPLGEAKLSDWKREDLFYALPAISYFLILLRQDNPDVRIICIANSDIKSEIVECMRDVSARERIEFVELSDVDKLANHPTVLGMEQICNQIIAQIGE